MSACSEASQAFASFRRIHQVPESIILTEDVIRDKLKEYHEQTPQNARRGWFRSLVMYWYSQEDEHIIYELEHNCDLYDELNIEYTRCFIREDYGYLKKEVFAYFQERQIAQFKELFFNNDFIIREVDPELLTAKWSEKTMDALLIEKDEYELVYAHIALETWRLVMENYRKAGSIEAAV